MLSAWKTGRLARNQRAGRLAAPKVVEARYVLALRRIMKQIHEEYYRALKENDQATRMDSYDKHTGVFQSLGVRVNMVLQKPVQLAFDQMAVGTSRANRQALALLKPSDTRLAATIAHARDENIRLVEKAARAYATGVRKVFDDPKNFGVRVEDLAAQLLERGDVSESRAELIARDQTLKTNAAINETRQTNAGVVRYTWSTSHDERVRESHRVLDSKVFAWDDPPDIDGEPLNPGEDFQCRCVAIPFIEGLDVDPDVD